MMTNEIRAEKLEFTACGPHARLSRRGLRDLFLLFFCSLALALFAKWAFRGGRFGVPPAAWWIGAAVAAVLAAALLVGILRRGENWALYLGATLVASLLTSLVSF